MFLRRRILVLVLPLAIAGGVAGDAGEPSFDVASIKPSSPGGLRSAFGGLRHGTFTAENVDLRQVLAAAYGMSKPRVTGPDWLDKDRFDIIAKSPPGVPDSQLKPMLQALLKDRFKLTAHLETREMPVYYLSVAKDGVKMPVYPAHDHGPIHPVDDPNVRGFPMLRGTFTTAELADTIARIVSRPVIDRTGLTKRYNLFLSYAPLSPQSGETPEFGPPDFFTAVQKQLGLKLQSGKDTVEVVVVNHIEQMPTEN
jgi:uncharacterized protein (TIGR03435 family)